MTRPLHQRVALLGWIRSRSRRVLLSWFGRLVNTDEGRLIARQAVLGTPVRILDLNLEELDQVDQKYPEVGKPDMPRWKNPRQGRAPVFVSARFRSGSTLLWNLFRNTNGCTAFYEPLNERQWFDLSNLGGQVDPTHLNVNDYWKEYEGLDQLKELYSTCWHYRDLLMVRESWHPRLRRFIEILLEEAPDRPILQFNRMDFRLPWLRAQFPDASLIHLYRHPRDQWLSTLMASRQAVGIHAVMKDFSEHDRFYLGLWVADLQHHFPFLAEAAREHPYRSFYFLWKLSYLFGRLFADHSVSFEDLIQSPERTFGNLLSNLGIENQHLADITSLVKEIELGRWSSYADNSWFQRHEIACETVLRDFLVDPAR